MQFNNNHANPYDILNNRLNLSQNPLLNNLASFNQQQQQLQQQQQQQQQQQKHGVTNPNSQQQQQQAQFDTTPALRQLRDIADRSNPYNQAFQRLPNLESQSKKIKKFSFRNS